MTLTDNVTLSKKQFVLFNKIVSILSFLSICVGFVLLLVGFIPFKGRDLSAIVAVNNGFEFIYIGRKDFWLCVTCVIVAIVYICFAVKNIISIIAYVSKINVWLLSKEDSNETRKLTKKMVRAANLSLRRFLILYVISYLVDEFIPTGMNILVIAGLIVLITAINCMSRLMFKGSITDSALEAANQSLLFAAPVIFIAMCPYFGVHNIINTIGFAVKSFTMNAANGEQLGLVLAHQILFPIFYMIVLAHTFTVCKKALSEKFDEKTVIAGLITNLVFLGIIMAVIGFINKYSNVIDYFGILLDNVHLLIVSLMVYFGSTSAVSKRSDIPIFPEDPPAEQPDESAEDQPDESAEGQPDESAEDQPDESAEDQPAPTAETQTTV